MIFICGFQAAEDAARFAEAAKSGNLVPLHRCIFSDHLTPVLAYRCLVREDDREAPSFLFESVEQSLGAANVVSFLIMSIFIVVVVVIFIRKIGNLLKQPLF